MTFNRKPYVKPERSAPVRSSMAPTSPVRMATVESFQRAPAVPLAPAKAHESRHRSTTVAEKAHMARVAALGCVLCARLGMPQSGKTDVHHVREDQGGAQRAPNWLTVALCQACHTGPHGIHGDRARLRQAKCTEMDLLAWTLEALASMQ